MTAKMKISGCVIVVFFATFTQSLSCPDQCICSQLKSGLNVDCSKKKFDTIPNGIPNNTVKLDLSGNNITYIGNSSFSSLSMLTDLKLSRNEIKTISPSAFNGLTSLKKLYMVHCSLSEWSEDLLTPLQKLTSLYLTDNEFQIIPNITSLSLSKLYMDKNKFTSLLFPNNFKHNVNLQSLVLSNNNIPQINDGDFFSLADLTIKSLKLSQCGLKNISSKALSNLPHLKTLDLNSNGLVSSQLDIILSQVSQTLESLSADHNQITNLSTKTFNGFANGKLNSLNMNGNPLSLIDPQAFSPLTRLTHLSLGNCKLSSIGSYLQPLKTLTYLNITHSELETIGNEAFSIDENSNNVVDFSKNPFKCDCSLAWFRNWIDGTKVTVRNVHQYLCGSPESFSGKLLLSFSAASCSQQSTTTAPISTTPPAHHNESALSIVVIVVIVICCVAALAFLVIVVLLIRRFRNQKRAHFLSTSKESLIDTARDHEREPLGANERSDESNDVLASRSLVSAYFVENPQLNPSDSVGAVDDSLHVVKLDALFLCSAQDKQSSILKALAKKMKSVNDIEFHFADEWSKDLSAMEAKRIYFVVVDKKYTADTFGLVEKLRISQPLKNLTLLKLDNDLEVPNLEFRKEISLSENLQDNFDLIFKDVFP